MKVFEDFELYPWYLDLHFRKTCNQYIITYKPISILLILMLYKCLWSSHLRAWHQRCLFFTSIKWDTLFSIFQNVSSSLLVQFLREHRSEWADLSIDAHSAASLKSGSFTFPGLNSFDFSASTELLGHTIDDDEVSSYLRNSFAHLTI